MFSRDLKFATFFAVLLVFCYLYDLSCPNTGDFAKNSTLDCYKHLSLNILKDTVFIFIILWLTARFFVYARKNLIFVWLIGHNWVLKYQNFIPAILTLITALILHDLDEYKQKLWELIIGENNNYKSYFIYFSYTVTTLLSLLGFASMFLLQKRLSAYWHYKIKNLFFNLIQTIHNIPKFRREEDIFLPNLKLAHIDFGPYLYFDPNTKNIQSNASIGAMVIEDILLENKGSSIFDLSQEYKWHTYSSGICLEDVDLLLTPIYEISERNQILAFSSPLFYVDIGIFAKASNTTFVNPNNSHDWFDINSNILNKKIKYWNIPGEINHKFAKKYLHKSGVPVTKEVESSIMYQGMEMLKKREIDLFICDRWYGEAHGDNNDIKNLLRKHQYRYPVGFVMRKKENALRKYLNRKILSISNTPGENPEYSKMEELLYKSFKGYINNHSNQEFYKKAKNLEGFGKDDMKDGMEILRRYFYTRDKR